MNNLVYSCSNIMLLAEMSLHKKMHLKFEDVN